MANKQSIFSNIKVQGQKLFNGAKDLFVEDGLLTNNVKKSISKDLKKSKDVYDDTLKAVSAFKGNDDVAINMMNAKIAGMDKGGVSSILGVNLDDKTAKDLSVSLGNKTGLRAYDKNITDDYDKAYEAVLRKTKGSVAAKSTIGAVKDYYAEPYKKAFANKASGVSFKENKAMHKLLARGGATAALGGTAVGVTASSISNSIENKKRRQY